MNLNRELHEAFGHCWHEKDIKFNFPMPTLWQCKCGICFQSFEDLINHIAQSNPDYVADPRLVIREMEKRKDYGMFILFIYSKLPSKDNNNPDIEDLLELIAIDTTGKFAQLALDWLKGEG